MLQGANFLCLIILSSDHFVCDCRNVYLFLKYRHSGLNVHQYRYYNSNTCGLDIDGCLSDLSKIPKGHFVLLHACAHNPTGVDPSFDQWQKIGEILQSRGLIPFFDCAYQVR